jgi:hypothetical protein
MAETVTKTREVEIRDNQVRGLKERDSEEFRKYQWQPADALPMPKAPDGWHYRYIRKSVFGDPDVNNFGRAMREGWVTVPLSDHPELAMSVDANSKNSGNIEIGALILCKLPVEILEARKQYYANMNAQQITAVDNNLMRENDPRMPLFNSRETKVSFGKGA